MILQTIKKREDFVKISKSNIKFFSKNIILTCCKIENINLIDNNIRHIGYVVTKRVGNAVIRNKAKRRLKHILSQHKDLMDPNFYYVIIAKSNAKNSQFCQIENDVIFCLKRILRNLKKN